MTITFTGNSEFGAEDIQIYYAEDYLNAGLWKNARKLAQGINTLPWLYFYSQVHL